MSLTYYEILNVPVTAKQEQIRQAYKALAVKYHPDKHPGEFFYEEHFKKISEAYQTLSDEEKRKRYDLKLLYQQQKSQPTTTPTSAPTHKKYQYTNPRKKRFDPEERKRTRKYYFIFGGALLLVIGGFLALALFMNHYAYNKYLNEADELYAKGMYKQAHHKYLEALYVNDEGGKAFLGLAHVAKKLYPHSESYINYLSKSILFAPEGEYSMHFERAMYFFDEQQYPNALRDLKLVTTINPRHDSAHFMMGIIYMDYQHDYDKAIEAFNETITLNPKSDKAYYYRGFCHMQLSAFEKATKDFSKAIELNDDIGRAYYYRGYSYINLEDSTNACLDFYKAQEFGIPNSFSIFDSYCK